MGAELKMSVHGETMSVAEWSRETGLAPETIRGRLLRMPPVLALILPDHAYVDPHALPGDGKHWAWDVASYEDDVWCQDCVRRHPDGATLEDVADRLCIVKQRVEQIESRAIQKLLRSRRGRKLVLQMLQSRSKGYVPCHDDESP